MRDDQIDMLRKLLRDLFNARYAGVSQPRLARAQGYVDGYMTALLRTKILTQREALLMVAEERARVAGPPVRVEDAAAALAS